MTTQFRLYFNDLNDKAKARYLKFQQVSNDSELNHEVEPIAIIDREEDDPLPVL